MPHVQTRPITAEEFADMPETGVPTELVRGEAIELPPPELRHGEVCADVTRHLANHVKPNGLGRVFGNDAGLERPPDWRSV